MNKLNYTPEQVSIEKKKLNIYLWFEGGGLPVQNLSNNFYLFYFNEIFPCDR